MISRPLLSEKAKTPIGCLLILLGIFYAYAQVSGHRFVEFDDGIYAFDNRKIMEGLNWSTIQWSFTNIDAANWSPLTWLSLLVDRELFGPHPGGYLLMNVAWHAVAACLCFVAFKKVTGSLFAAMTIALIFALHPANVENVAWLSSRKSILDAAFWFLGIYIYIKFLETKRPLFYLLVFVTHLMGLMSKSMHVTFPCTLWLVHILHFYSTRETAPARAQLWQEIKATLKYTAPMLLLSAYFCAVTLVAQEVALSNLSLGIRAANAFISYGRYLFMFFNPTSFAPFYPLFPEDINVKKVASSVAILIMISGLCLITKRRRPDFLLGWLWYLGTMVPVIGFVQVGAQSHADRYLYIPCIGLGLMLVTLVRLLPRTNRWTKAFSIGWLAAVASSLAVATQIQASYWKNGVTLFQHSLAVTGDCMTSVTALSSAYNRLERNDDGITFLESKIALAKNPINKTRLLLQISSLYIVKGNYTKALKLVEESIAIGSSDKRTYYNAAFASQALNNLDKADDYIQKATKSPSIKISDIDFSAAVLEVYINDLSQKIKKQKAALE